MSDENQPPKQNVSYSMSGNMSAGGMGGGMSASASASLGGAPAPAPQPAAPPVPTGPAVKDISTQSFMADVIDASQAAPVIVDFWAPWCGPCKQLGPIIEKTVTDAVAEGYPITLCKMDVEKYPEVSQQMGIQSIPAVVAFINGRPADAFMGAKSQKEVKEFIDKVAAQGPAPAGKETADALAIAEGMIAEGEAGEASEIYGSILAREPGNLDALTGLGKCYIAVGEMEMADKLIEQVPEEQREEEPLASLVKSIELAKQGAELGELTDLEKAAEADPKNHQARFDYAMALNANGEREKAAEQLIEIVRADRTWNEDGARAQLLEFFENWGNADPATMAGRRALSSVLFS